MAALAWIREDPRYDVEPVGAEEAEWIEAGLSGADPIYASLDGWIAVRGFLRGDMVLSLRAHEPVWHRMQLTRASPFPHSGHRTPTGARSRRGCHPGGPRPGRG